ncbi:MAG: hypothetical protein ACYS0D_01145 [Planctomycetota bacterium]
MNRLVQWSKAAWRAVPPRVPAVDWPELRPRTRTHWLACSILWAAFGAYLITWIAAHWGWLFDPMLQNDDARTTLFPFHRYGLEHTLRDDPVTQDMVGLIPPSQWLIYRCLTPVFGLYAASKVMQLVCLAIIGVAGVLLVRARRGGLAAGLILVFLFLHTPGVVNRIGGGHPRGFAFPLIALWTAGAIARRPRARFGSALAGAVLYPPVMLLLLGAEGVLSLRAAAATPRAVTAARLRRYAVLAGVCVLVAGVQVAAGAGHGRIHTLAEARQDPIFQSSPRDILPFRDPDALTARFLAHPFHANGEGPVPALLDWWAGLGTTGPLAILAILLALRYLRFAPPAPAALALLCAAIAAYGAARLLAFRLYNPERYLSFGMTAATLCLAVTVLGGLWARHGDRTGRAVRRNLAAAGAIVCLWIVAGDGMIRRPELARDRVVFHNGTNLDGRREADLYRFIREMPADARIAMHPLDGAGITYWTGRATTEHFETLQPWQVESWQRLRARTTETIRALYATDETTFLDYCDRFGITHVLVHVGRYGDDFAKRAGLFAPFDHVAAKAVAGVDRDRLIIPRLADHSTIYFQAPWLILEVEHIRANVTAARQALAED